MAARPDHAGSIVMSMDASVCGKVVTPFGVVDPGMVLIKENTIAFVGPRDDNAVKDVAIVHDFPDRYVIPGLFDIHCHAGAEGFFYEDPKAFAAWHLRHGVTSILPTFMYNQSHSEIMETLDPVIAEVESDSSPIVGLHMEGPYINPKYGAITSPVRGAIPSEYEEILERAGRHIKIWTLAPELDGQTAFMERASQFGIVFAVGHSEASAEEIFNAHRLGLRLGCHLTNASGTTPSPTRYDGTREVGVDEAVMVHDDMYAELIADRDGIHVRPLMLQLVLKAKGVDHVILITDATGHVGESPDRRDVRMVMSNENSPTGAGKEMISGSLLTLNLAVRNMMRHTGVGIVDACKMASLNPARLLNMDRDIGSIEVGKRANMAVVTQDMDVQMVMLDGRAQTP